MLKCPGLWSQKYRSCQTLPQQTQNLDDLILARRKGKKVSEQIPHRAGENLYHTGLEREDIESLAYAAVTDGAEFWSQREKLARGRPGDDPTWGRH